MFNLVTYISLIPNLAKCKQRLPIFSYFHNFVAKSDQDSKTKNGMNETLICKQISKWHWNIWKCDGFYKLWPETFLGQKKLHEKIFSQKSINSWQ